MPLVMTLSPHHGEACVEVVFFFFFVLLLRVGNRRSGLEAGYFVRTEVGGRTLVWYGMEAYWVGKRLVQKGL